MKKVILIISAVIMALMASVIVLYCINMPIKTAIHQIYQSVVAIQAILLFIGSLLIWGLTSWTSKQ